MPRPDVVPHATLGDAILRARNHMLDTGEGCTVVLADHVFCTIASARYAALRERGESRGLDPLFSFLPNGGLDVHRASFEPLGAALANHTRF